jgi:uncharacterized alpha-E superfamily protein
MRSSIKGTMATTFLLTDPHFPRSQHFCLEQIKLAASVLPRADVVAEQVNALLNNTHGVEKSDDLNQNFSRYLNDIQLGIITLHHQIKDNWFQYLQGDAA